jgi:uncharacterized RDD family membrane protein YckC
MVKQNLHNLGSAGFGRRLMASVYDWLLIIAVMMVLSVPVVALLNDPVSPGNFWYRIALSLVALLFFTGFWVWGGQTLGMKAWRLRLLANDGGSVAPERALLRFAYACVSAIPAGLGFLWVIWDPDGLSWHDRWSGTVIELQPKRSSGS